MFLHSEVAGAIKTIKKSQRAHLCGARIPNRTRRLMWRSQNPAPNRWFTTCDAGGQNTCQSATPTASPKTGISPSVGSVGDSLRQRPRRIGDQVVQNQADPPSRILARLRPGRESPPSNTWTGSTTDSSSKPIGDIPPAEKEANHYSRGTEGHAVSISVRAKSRPLNRRGSPVTSASA